MGAPSTTDNRTFRLGDELSVRLPAGPGYALDVAKEQRWLLGRPGEGYPFPWSVYRWIEGESAAATVVSDLTVFATDLARFLGALRQADPAGGPGPGEHSFFRGGSLVTHHDETLASIATLTTTTDCDRFDADGCRAI